MIKFLRVISVWKIFEILYVILDVVIVVRIKKLLLLLKIFLDGNCFMSICMVSNFVYLNSRGWSILGKFLLSFKYVFSLNGFFVLGIMEGWFFGIIGNCVFV